jgi:hypothetical protein
LRTQILLHRAIAPAFGHDVTGLSFRLTHKVMAVAAAGLLGVLLHHHLRRRGAAGQGDTGDFAQRATDRASTRKVSENVADVQRGGSETGSASSQVLSAAHALSQESNRLKREVGKFLETVRAA